MTGRDLPADQLLAKADEYLKRAERVRGRLAQGWYTGADAEQWRTFVALCEGQARRYLRRAQRQQSGGQR